MTSSTPLTTNTPRASLALDRRTMLKAAGAAGAVAASGLGLGATAVSAQDEVVFNFVNPTGAPESIDPAENWNGAGGFVIMAHVYESLFRFVGAENAELVPLLAAEIPTLENGGISEDGLVYTIKLRPEATFADGSPLTAEAIKFNYDRVKSLALGVDFMLDAITETEVVDDHTVALHLEEPFSPLLSSLGSIFANQIVNPAVAEAESTGDDDLGNGWLKTHAAGSGPYILEDFQFDLGTATLVRNVDWWQGWDDQPHLDRVFVQYIPESATARLMIEQGDVDYVAGIPAESFAALSEVEGLTTVEGISLGQTLIVTNSQLAPFDNQQVRQALAYAINYDVIINDIWGGGQQLDSIVPPMIGYAPAATQYSFDLAKTQELLAEAGYADGLDLEIAVDQGDENGSLTLQLIQSDLASIGVNLTITPMDGNAMFAQMLNGDPAEALPAMFTYIGSDYPDAYQLLALCYGSRSLPPASCCNFGYYDNPEMDEIIATVERENDPDARQAALQAGFDLAFDDLPLIWIHSIADRAVMKDTVVGWEYNFVNGSSYVPLAKMSLAQ